MNNTEALTIDCKLNDPSGRFIPAGLMVKLKVIIMDEVATFKMSDGRACKRFALAEIQLCKERGVECNTVWVERMQQALTKYPGRKKDEIREIIISQLGNLGATKVKN